MFTSISGPELLMILVLGLLLFGPRRLPEISRKVGKIFSEFRRATTDFRMNLEREVEVAEKSNDEPAPELPETVSRASNDESEHSEPPDESTAQDS